jgi:hypothetical protein
LPDAINFNIGLQPKQKRLWLYWNDSPFTKIGFGGSRGGAKSGGARRGLFLRRWRYPLTNGLILRRTYDELKKNHIEPMFREFPILKTWWKEGEKALHFPNGSIQYFGFAEHLADVERYVGSEFADIVPEEAGLFSEQELKILQGSVRWTYPDHIDWSSDAMSAGAIVPKMVFPFMPGGPGHVYLKRVFVDRDFRDTENPDDYAFIQAHGWDNVEWARESLTAAGYTEDDYYSWTEDQRKAWFLERTTYGLQLMGIADKQLRDAWIEGLWDVHEGTVFPELDADVHDLDQFLDPSDDPHARQAIKDWKKHLKLMASMDHATTGVTAMEQTAVDHDENLFALDEYYERNRPIAEHAAAMIPMLLRWSDGNLPGLGRHLGQQYILIDPSTEAKTLQKSTHTGRFELTSVLIEYSEHGIRATPAQRAMISVGLDVLHGLLAVDPKHRNPFTGKLGSPRLFISRKRCPELWREMKDLQKMRDPLGNWKFIGSDHALDNVRYIAMSRPSPARQAEKDIANLPTIDQVVHRSHEKWAKGWGQTESSQWFGGTNRR